MQEFRLTEHGKSLAIAAFGKQSEMCIMFERTSDDVFTIKIFREDDREAVFEMGQVVLQTGNALSLNGVYIDINIVD